MAEEMYGKNVILPTSVANYNQSLENITFHSIETMAVPYEVIIMKNIQNVKSIELSWSPMLELRECVFDFPISVSLGESHRKCWTSNRLVFFNILHFCWRMTVQNIW